MKKERKKLSDEFFWVASSFEKSNHQKAAEGFERQNLDNDSVPDNFFPLKDDRRSALSDEAWLRSQMLFMEMVKPTMLVKCNK